MRIIKAGATSQIVYIEVLDSTSTTGGRKTGLVYNSASLTAYYVRNGGSATAITLATLAAANSAYSSGGFKEVDATNMPGIYRLDLPDAAVAAGATSVVVTLKGASGMVQVSLEIQLVTVDPQDAVRFGLTALPNAAADAAGGLPISDAGGLDLDAKLANTNEITAARMGALTDWINGGRLDLIIDAILADTNELQTDWVNGGRLDLLIDAIKVVTDLLNTAQAEPTGAPAVNETPIEKLAYLFMALRNKITVTASTKTFFDDGGAAEWTKALSDDGTTYTEAEGA